MSPKSINKALDKVGEDYSTRLTQKNKRCQITIHQSQEVLQTLKGNLDKLKKQRPSSYCLILDSLDKRIEASDMTSENQNKDHHWCNHNAVFDRVNPVELPDYKPLSCILDVPNKLLLPALEDNKNILNDFADLGFWLKVCLLLKFSKTASQYMKRKYFEEIKKNRPTWLTI